MFHAPSQDLNLKTKGLTITASLQSNVFNVLKFGSPHWTVPVENFAQGEMPS